ncbi:MAG: proprotein convertase P-domain-containing protein [Gemmataceae bacterium]
MNVSTFDVSDVTVLYRAPGTDRTVAATRIPVSAIVALDPVTTQSGFPDDATRFFVRFATPQSAAGTYSYAVGPNVSDRIRTPRIAIFTPPDTPTPLPDLRMVESTISVPELISLPVGSPTPTVVNMEVKLDIAHTFVGDLRITLFGPDPDGPGPLSAPSVVLSNRRGGAGSFSGIRFNDSAITPIANFPAGPGIYRAETPLAAFNGQPMSGNWTLRVEDLDGSDSGTLRGWTLTFLDAGGAPVTSIMQAATFMDQDGDSRTREIGTNFDNSLPASQQAPKLYTDAYTAPGSSGRDQFNIDPFAAPVANNTLPLISTGPHLVLVGNPGETAVVSFATRSASNPLILNVTLDRAVDITTFDISDVLAVVNQAGPVAATLVNVVPTNAANEIASKFDFVFSGPNLPTGKYSVSLGTDFLVADGMFRNVESNQMLVRFDRDIDPASFTSQNVLRITGPIGDIQDVQDITVLGTAGTFTVTFSDATGSQTTAALPYNIPASGGITTTSSLQNAIAALTKVGAGNVVVTVENLVGGGRVFHVVFTGLLRSTQLPMTAVGTGGTTVSVNRVGITVTPVPTTVNAVTGGARAFFVTYPKQNISGPYTIEFGQNPLGGSIRAVDVPQLVSVVSTPTTTLDVTFLGARDEVQQAVVSGTAGTFTLTFNGQTTAPLAFNATALQVRSALEALPGIGSGNVQVALSSAAGANTYTITFTGGLAKTDVAQLVAAGAGGTSASVTTTTNGRSDSAVAADLIRLTGPSGNVSLAGVTAARIGTSSTFRFTFPTALTPGQYVLDFNPAFRVANTGPAMDMNFNAGLDTLRGDDPASNDLDPLSYASTNAVAIPPAPTALDPTLTESFIVVDQDYIIRQSTLEQIRVLLNISHPDVRGLTIDLVPPDSTGVGPIRLFTGSLATRLNSTNSANFENTLLVDRVGDPNVTNIEAGNAPFRSGGSFYSPQTPLSALVGKSSKGVWTLRVQNDGTNTQTSDPNFVTGDPIQITNWGLTLPRALTVEAQRFDRTSGVPIDPTTVTVTTTRAGSATVSEVQTIAVIGTTGTFTISFNGATTGSLARTATALQIQNALNGLSTIGGVGGSVSVSAVVTGNNQTFTVTFGGALANRDVPQMTTSATPVITDSSITIPVDFVITETTLNQIRMLVNITHPNVRDLDIDLIGPDGTTVRLFTGTQLAPTASNQSANFTNTRFSNRVGDPSTPSIQSAIPPFNAGEAGFFSPQNSLDPFVGKHTLGTWTLRVTNRGTNAATTDPNFNPNAPIQIVNWNITFPKQVATTGLGQANADRFQAAFRVFTQDPTNTLTQTTWTPVGPAPTNETNNAARISAMAVDPTDPSGNTVYVAVAGGGIWKTTDFLNSSSALQNGGLVPRGPSYVPLTDFGPTSAVNISSIALFPRNNDPHQTIVFALTGEPSTLGKMPGSLTSAGVGVIRSLDGGRSWQVLDSTRNVDAAGNVVLMSDQNTRDHLFVGATGYKIVVDPKPGRDGGVIVYMALSGNANQNGLWRSLNGGNTWTRVMAGNATDVVLAAGSANVTDPASGKTVFEGNLQQLYAGFRNTPAGGPGVYKTDSAPAALSLDFMAGGTTNPLIIDTSITGSPSVTTNNPVSIPNSGNRITLAVPALTGDPLKDSFLKDWVYAMTDDAAGNAQLYMTKDAGAHWTRVRMPNLPYSAPVLRPDFPNQGTNDESGARLQTDVETVSDYNMALAVDPENPYIVYMAGAGNNSIRLDLTTMSDAHNFTFYDNSDPGFVGAGGVQTSTVGGFQPRTAGARGAVRIGGSNSNYVDSNGVAIGFLNLFGGRDYNQPFITNSVVRVRNTGDEPNTLLAGSFVNNGTDISWSPFEDIFQTEVPGQTGSARTQNRFDGANTHAIVSFTDPVTGKTRLIFGTDDGVFTGVDSASTIGTGTLSDGIGFSSAVKGNRNGNLQVSQFWSGAVQPSQLAADLAGALFYGMGDQSGFPVSSPNILASGDLNWRGPTGDGVSVLVDQAGSGTAFQYRSPLASGFDLNATALEEDFFRVLSNTSDHAFGGGFSRTGNSTGSLFDQAGEFWRNNTASIITNNPLISQPNANPANPNILIFGSATGRVYRSTDQGVTWVVKAQPGNLDGTPVLSVAFGASDPALPTLVNNFMYAGTNGGRIYSTTTGGTPWTLIGSAANGLNGAAVIRVIPNPQVGTKDVFALTTSGVFYKADGTTAAGNWVNITGNLFNLTRTVFGNPADLDPALRANSLTALAVDWRYAFPQPLNPSQTFPVLYAAGDGGVFRTKDFGTTWTFFPDVANDGAAADGGYLPNTHITDLDLSIGNLDPNTGRYQSGGFNMLVATTYGRGTFAIRLDPNIPASSFVSGPRVTQLINPNPVNGPSAQLQVRFSSAVDPATFTPADVQIIGPGGTSIPITSVNMISVPDANGVNPRNLFAITFPTQAGLGSYDVTIGYNPTGNNVPLISDPSGFLMNQDNDTVNGEPIVDQYRSTIILNSNTNNRLVVTSSPSSAVAGSAYSVTIQARDANDLLLGNVNGTLTLTPAPGTGTFTPNTVNIVNGVAIFDVTYQTAGDQTINVAFNSLPAINGTAWTTTVVAGAATQFSIAPANSTVTASNTPMSFTITAQDAFGNTAKTYNQTATLSRAGAAATIPASVVLANGVGTFNGTFPTTGTVQITATGPDLANPPSGTITGTANVSVVPGTATQLGISISAGPYTIGSTATVTVRALDALGNLANNLNGTTISTSVSPTGQSIVNPANPQFVNGVATYTITFQAAGTFTITNTANGPITGTITVPVTAAPPPPSPTDNLPAIYAVGSGANGSQYATIYNGDGSVRSTIEPFPPGFNQQVDPSRGGFFGGIRVAVGDVTGDGVPDYVMGSGPTIQASVTVFNGATGKRILDYKPFENFTGGVFVTTGDITGDGIDEIIMTPDEGGGPRVTVLRGGDFARIFNFFGIRDESFRGGARAAVGDLNGDGFGELVVAAGFGGGPRISIYDGAFLAQGKFANPIGDFFIFEEGLRNGAYVAVGDVNGDGFGDLVAGAGPGGGPRVMVVSGKKLLEAGPDGPYPALAAPIANYFAGDPNARGGVRVTTKNIDGDRNSEVVTGSGGSDDFGNLGGSRVSVYLGKNLTANNYLPVDEFDYITGFYNGVFVG